MTDNILESIEDEFIQINYRWKIFCQLYDSEENVALLNKSGSNVFELFQKLLIYDVISSLCTLTDPPRSARKDNASIKGYLEKANVPSERLDKVNPLMSKLTNEMTNMRIVRNKAMSHRDIDYATKVLRLPDITYDNIENSINILRGIINILSNSSEDYIPHIPYGGDGNKLLKLLKKVHDGEKS